MDWLTRMLRIDRRQLQGKLNRLDAGFTLIELLVSISIIGMLIAILLPAVQAAREAARRMQCQNNLKQIGLALQNYHAGLKTFPSGYISSWDNSGRDTGPGWGWGAQLLPFIEQAAVHNSIDFAKPIESATNTPARMLTLNSWLCPSDSSPNPWNAVTRDGSGNPIGTICQVAAANYIGVFGVTEPGVDGEGVFFRNSRISMKDIVDGTSATMAVGERSHQWGQATWVGAVTNAKIFPPPGSPAIPIAENASCMVLGHTFEGPPNSPNTEGNNFSSEHSNGATFAFADGHVEFISSSINKDVYRALSTRAAAEVIGDY